jgi:DNA-binding winged helix-turn-helix (wHTH) protein
MSENTYPEFFLKDQLDTLYSWVKNGDSSIVTGIPGIGKTKFMYLFQEKLKNEDNFKVVFADLNKLEKFNETDCLDFLLREINYQLGTNLNSYSDLITLTKSWDSDKKLIIIVDRFDKALQNLQAEFFDKLKWLTQHSHQKVVLVTAYDKTPNSLTEQPKLKEFYSHFGTFTLVLRLLNEEESIFLVNNEFYRRGLTPAKGISPLVISRTGGHSRLLKFFARYAILHIVEDPRLEFASEDSSIQSMFKVIEESLNKKELETLLYATPNTPEHKTLKKFGYLDAKGAIFSEAFEIYLDTKIAAQGFYLGRSNEIFFNNIQVDKDLTVQEYSLLKLLVSKNETICSKQDIVEEVWGKEAEKGVSDEAIDQLVLRLRQKMTNIGIDKDLIQTIRGRGYLLNQNSI